MWTVLKSEHDKSVNHVKKTQDGGMIECRYVQRTDDYFIIYVSSHTGCALSCRFCHLTATKQVMMTDVSFDEYIEQVKQVLSTYQSLRKDGLPSVSTIHVNFMSRGEALANKTVLEHSGKLYRAMEEAIQLVEPNAEVKFLVSSIIPKTFKGALAEVLDHPRAFLYYSLYSLSPEFRKKWLPKAHQAEHALDLIERYQKDTKKPIALHWAVIDGQNDDQKTVAEIARAVGERNIRAKFNLVRYNPYDARGGEEASEEAIDLIFEGMKDNMLEEGSRIVPRVGFDVKASCGMFLEAEKQ